jgi:hypothetical protein
MKDESKHHSTMRERILKVFFLAFFFFILQPSSFILSQSFILTAHAQGSVREPLPEAAPLVKHMTVMPYLTGSLNIMSGLAFPGKATGPGFGGGLTFDMTEEGQSAGLMFDFAFQDMYAVSKNGSCINPGLGSVNPGDTSQTIDLYLETADAYHYFYYLLFEPFLKLQSAKDHRGYFMIGASIGMPVLMETYFVSEHYHMQAQWNNSPYGHRLRLDARVGVGVKLGKIKGHDFMLEARGGYPITPVITDYVNQCSATGDIGDWKIFTLQINLGIRL